jgi:hypothetical protein
LDLEFLPDDVDFGVVGDGFESDVTDAFVNKALADVVVGWEVGRWFTGDFGFLELAFARVGESVIGIAGTHDAGASEGNTGGVDGDPAAAPLFAVVAFEGLFFLRFLFGGFDFFTVAVVGFVIEDHDVLQAHEFTHDAQDHPAFGFQSPEWLARGTLQELAADF